MPPEPESDLHWTAFLYVAGELSPVEASRFEGLLAEDQGAREAVALAVELAGALAVVGLERAPAPRKRTARRALAWSGSLAAAACVAALVVATLRPVAPASAEPDASVVALAWSGLRVGDDPDWLAFVDGSRVPEPSTPGQADESEDASGSETSTDRALPSWLLSAASAPRGEAPQEEN